MRKTKGGPTDIDRHVGRRLREGRLSHGYSQDQLAKALKVTFQQVQKYETGRNRIGAGRLWEIACFLRVSPEYFFKGLGGKTENAPVESDRNTLECSRLLAAVSLHRKRAIIQFVRAIQEEETAK